MLSLLLLLSCGDRDKADDPSLDTAQDSDATTQDSDTAQDSDDPGDDTAQDSDAPVDADGDSWSLDQDCDDSDPSVNPGAAEICGNGVDEDCDGVDQACASSDEVSLGAADAWFVGEPNDSDSGAGATLTWAGDLDGDGYTDIAIGATHFADNRGALYLVRGPVSGRVELADADARLLGSAEDAWLGHALGGLGDYDGDGLDDLIVSEPLNEEGAVAGGAVYILTLPLARGLAEAHARILPGPDYTLLGGHAGCGVGGAGDLDGDGLGDAILTAKGPTEDGGAYLFRGPASGELGLEDADASFVRRDGGSLWCAAGVGDLDGDGQDDLALGTALVDDSADNAGSVYLFTGSPEGVVRARDADLSLLGEAEGEQAGFKIAGAGDVNGDGHADLLVGAPKHDDATLKRVGAAYLMLGPLDASDRLRDADAVILGDTEDLCIGWELAGGGDLNGDGFDELLLGSQFDLAPIEEAGEVWVLFGPVEGSLGVGDADVHISGGAAFDHLSQVAGVGDSDGDGLDDFVIGAPGYDGGAGAAWLFSGDL